MEKIILIIALLITATGFAQQDKGKISFEFNGDKIELPFSIVEMRKDNDITIVARGEKNDSTSTLQISMEATKANSLKLGFTNFRLQINMIDKKKDCGKEFTLSFGPQDIKEAQFGRYNKGIKVICKPTSFHAGWTDDTVKFENNHFIISCGFNALLKASGDDTDKTEISEIKNGYFEIIF